VTTPLAATTAAPGDLDGLHAQLVEHVPGDPREAWAQRRMLGLLAWLPAPWDQHADPVHLMGSAIVMDAHGRVLLHRHKRLGRWLQPGGHLDPGELPAEAARRETREETGLVARHLDASPRPLHLDVHEGGRGHVHLDVRYLLVADGDLPFAPADGESAELAWLSADDASRWGDHSVATAVAAARRRR
jgi:8-oxo-dGTP pyrophosphatase MutT (NUDIX family)